MAEHLKTVQPTILFTVPRLLEKIYEGILKKASQLRGLKKIIFEWGLNLAKCYQISQKPTGFHAIQLQMANKLVFAKLRAIFGGRIKCLLCGGAALQADIVNIFSATKITVLQAYGLTESSSAICATRGKFNRAGTVGIPIAGVEIALADDAKKLTKMQL